MPWQGSNTLTPLPPISDEVSYIDTCETFLRTISNIWVESETPQFSLQRF